MNVVKKLKPVQLPSIDHFTLINVRSRSSWIMFSVYKSLQQVQHLMETLRTKEWRLCWHQIDDHRFQIRCYQ